MTAPESSASPYCGWATLAGFVRGLAERHGARDAVVSPDVRLTFAALDRESASLARGLLASGIGKYTRVAFMMPNSPEWITTWLAIARIGAVAVPLSTFASTHELRRMLAHCDCAALLIDLPDAEQRLTALLSGTPEVTSSDGHCFSVEAPHLRWVASADGAPRHTAVRSIDAIHAAGRAIDERILEAVESELHPSDPVTMIYTSGSTSDPKGVVHSHEGVLTRVAELAHEFSHRADDRVYTSMPFFWVGGLGMVLLPTLAAGGCIATLERPVPVDVADLIGRERLTRVFLYPARTVNTVMADASWQTVDLSTVERGIPRAGCGMEWSYSYTTHGDTMGLGMSETFTAYWWGVLDGTDTFTPPLCRLSDGWEIKIVKDDGELAGDGEQGEILVRGPSLTIGLQKVRRADCFDADGYYRTGDLGSVDGHLVRFRGRRGDVIKTAGANVSAAEVAAALLELDSVAEAVVIGYPDAERGTVPGAVIVAASGFTLDEVEVIAAMRERLAGYKVPRRIIVAASPDEIPMTATGKVAQKELRQRFVDLPVTAARP